MMKQQRFSISARSPLGLPPGVSLVEAIVAMGIATIMMGISITTMQTVMRAERETNKAAWYGSSFHRFSRLFRSDIHAANSLELQNEAILSSLEMTIQKPGNESVQYRIEENHVFRIVAREGKQVHQDTFYFPAGSEVFFFERKRLKQAGISIGQAQEVLVPRQRKAPDNKNAVKKMSIISTIGFDHRLATPGKNQTKK